MRIIDAIILNICRNANIPISENEIILRVYQLPPNILQAAEFIPNKRNLYRIIKNLVDQKLLGAEYTKSIPRECMVQLSELGRTHLDTVVRSIQSPTPEKEITTRPYVPETMKVGKKVTSKRIEELIIAEIYDDNMGNIDSDTMKKIKKAVKSISSLME